jgi:hypothetical protein
MKGCGKMGVKLGDCSQPAKKWGFLFLEGIFMEPDKH